MGRPFWLLLSSNRSKNEDLTVLDEENIREAGLDPDNLVMTELTDAFVASGGRPLALLEAEVVEGDLFAFPLDEKFRRL